MSASLRFFIIFCFDQTNNTLKEYRWKDLLKRQDSFINKEVSSSERIFILTIFKDMDNI